MLNLESTNSRVSFKVITLIAEKTAIGNSAAKRMYERPIRK